MLINCVAYQEGQKLEDILVAEISDYLEKPKCFVWVAIKDPSPAELQQMQQEFDLHPLAVEDAQRGHQRPKIEEYDGSLFVVLHMIDRDASNELLQGEVAIFAGSNFILSVRHQATHGFQDVRARCEREPELLKYNAGFVLYALMDSVVDRYFPILAYLEAELEQIEDRIFAGGASPRLIVEELYALKRRLMTVHHATAPLLEATGKLFGGRTPQICSGMQDYYRDIYDHLQRIARAIEGLREMVTTAIQVNLALITLAENEVMKKLGSYAALFAVPTMIAGIYGMNFEFIPELKWRWGYPLSVLVMVSADIFLWWRFRRAGWL